MRGKFDLKSNEEECNMLWGKGDVSAFASVIAYPIGGQVYLIFESDKKKKNRKKLWRFPGGKVNASANETLRQGAYREVVEEVGFVLDPNRLEFVRGILKEDETGDFRAHLMCFFSYNMLHKRDPATKEDRADVFIPGDEDDDVTLVGRRCMRVRATGVNQPLGLGDGGLGIQGVGGGVKPGQFQQPVDIGSGNGVFR